MNQHDVAEILNAMATLLEISGANPFRVRAYSGGARSLESVSNFSEHLADGTLSSLHGIGKGLAEQITELCNTGEIQELNELRNTIPAGVVAMTTIPGVGPKKVKLFWKELGITTIAELAEACQAGKIAPLPRMGEKTQTKILEAITYLQQQQGKFLYLEALALAQQFEKLLHDHPAVIRTAIAGSMRRHKEVVKDIDLIASTVDAAAVMAAFVAHPLVTTIVGQGATKSSVRTALGINIDLRCVTDQQFPYTLHHFTGSKEHNTTLRARAKSMGLKMNEYGLFRIEGDTEALIECADETEIFAALGLDYIDPTLRENMGECDAAANHTLPTLLTPTDIRGAFHFHTTASDGKNTLEEMAAAARSYGWDYLGVSDHSQSAGYAGGLKIAAVQAQAQEIATFNTQSTDLHIFHGIESDILKDGNLDYTDTELELFDFVIASIHSSMKLDSATMTARICKALEHPATRIFAHPTARLLNTREGIAVDMETVLRCAGAHNVAVEINCSPKRSELDWRLGQLAQQLNVQTCISPDAHSVEGFQNVRYGVGLARKGWWTADQVINTWPHAKLADWLARK